MNSTEDDVTALLREIALDAPERSSFAVPTGRPRRKPVVPLLAAAVVIALIAGLATIVSLSGGHDGTTPAAARSHPAKTSYDGRHWSAVPPRSTFTPTAMQRHQLLAMARESAAMNGNRPFRASVAGTTIARLCAKYPGPFCTGTAAHTAKEYGLPSPSTRVWFIWLRGQFGTDPEPPDSHPVMGDLVDARTMRGLVGTYDLDTGYGVHPGLMAPLGVVVRLR